MTEKNRKQQVIEAVYALLESEDRDLTSGIIEERLKVAGSEVREAVGTLRDRGKFIASGSFGYRLVKTREELEHTIRHMESRIRVEARRVRIMKGWKPTPKNDTQLAMQF